MDKPERETNKDPRRDRLKQALRENLKRRRSQAKARGDVLAAPSKSEDASPDDGQIKDQAKARGENPDE